MHDEDVPVVRHFHRTVTARIGALDEHYLDDELSLGAARVLWEIGIDEPTVRELRDRLGLDSGYVSRVLRGLESSGLASSRVDDEDRRRRRVHLTASGRRRWSRLDDRSTALVERILEPLAERQRKALVTAMAEVDRILRSTMIEIVEVDPESKPARTALERYFAELGSRFDLGFDFAGSLPADAADLRPPRGTFLVATLAGETVGCGALKLHGHQPAEIKRMWVDIDVRGLGLGRRLLDALEAAAVGGGATVSRLETNRTLSEAIAMYRQAGYREVSAFNDERYAQHWFEKQLG